MSNFNCVFCDKPAVYQLPNYDNACETCTKAYSLGQNNGRRQEIQRTKKFLAKENEIKDWSRNDD